jgi:hypothetical protein
MVVKQRRDEMGAVRTKFTCSRGPSFDEGVALEGCKGLS